MTIGTDTFPASFRGISFVVPRESETGGVKNVVHEYPGSNFRFVEDLGPLPSIFNLTAIIHGVGASARRRALVTAMQAPGTGTLRHPVYGTVQVKATDFTVTSSDDSLGEYVFELTFYASRTGVTLGPSSVTAAFISSLFATFRPNLYAAFGSTIQTPTTALNIASATRIIDQFATQFSDALILPTVVASQRSRFLAAIDFISENTGTVAATSNSMQRFLSNALEQTVTLYTDVSDPLNAWLGLTTFDPNEVQMTLTTAERIQRETNLMTFQDFFQTFALVSAMESSVYRQYRTAQEITQIINQIEERFIAIFREPSSGLTRNFALVEEVSTLFARTIDFLKALNINAPMVVTVTTDASSAALTAYQYYGSVEREEVISGLNSNLNRSALIGDIQVLTE